MAKQIGYAVVGAGPLVERALLPAFGRAGGETRLAAIVSADRARAHAREKSVPRVPVDDLCEPLDLEVVLDVYCEGISHAVSVL